MIIVKQIKGNKTSCDRDIREIASSCFLSGIFRENVRKCAVVVVISFSEAKINQELQMLETRFPLSCYILIHNTFRSQKSFVSDAFWDWETRCP